MSGRKLFKGIRRIIILICRIFEFLPNWILEIIWALTCSLRGIVGVGFRYCVVRARSKECGDNVYVGRNVEIKGWDNLVIGSNVSIHKECFIDASGGLRMGDNISIAHQTSIMTQNHTWKNESLPIKYNPLAASPVWIEEDVWIGCGARIFAGVKIGKRSIVAGGAVVVKNVESRTIVAGVPAKVIKEI